MFWDDNEFDHDACLVSSKIMNQRTFSTIVEKFCNAWRPDDSEELCWTYFVPLGVFEIDKMADGNYVIGMKLIAIMVNSQLGDGSSARALMNLGMPIYFFEAKFIVPSKCPELENVVLDSVSHHLAVSKSASKEIRGWTENFIKKFPVPVITEYPSPEELETAL
jgi:hypothetical protein